MIVLIYALNCMLCFSCLLDVHFRDAEQRFAGGLVRIFFLLPLLAVGYLYLGAKMQSYLIAPVFFSENIFALTLFGLAYTLKHLIDPKVKESILYRVATIVAIIAVMLIGIYWLLIWPAHKIIGTHLIFPYHGQLYFSSLFLLIAVFVMAWRVELFWRALNPQQRSRYKYLVIGIVLIIGALGWSSSFRIVYLKISGDHLLLLAILLLTGWLLITYAMARNRLLNRGLFISRKVVYSTVAPLIFSCYLIILGIISLLMRISDWSLGFITQWMIIIVGLLVLAAFALSDRFRARVKYFISTHFYVNKYEYRDEWLAFSTLLHRRLTEKDIVEALRHILHDSLYTDTIKIWIGDTRSGFHLTDSQGNQSEGAFARISPGDPMLAYLQNAPLLDCRAHNPTPAQQRIFSEKSDFLKSMGLVLMVPLTIGNHFAGIIGLGSEYTGGRYGKDDFDLLAALGSQAASALLAAQKAEELAKAREVSAFHTLSAFVLHDIKNAATMLSLVKDNAPKHIQNPEFQKDMLASIEDALKRMLKVQTRLKTLKGEMVPIIRKLDIVALLRNCCKKFAKKLPDLNIDVLCESDHLRAYIDPEYFSVILENLLINAREAGGNGTRVQIRIKKNQGRYFRMEFTDDGPGIPSEILPDRLFEPFVTGKQKGSGIGLWQVKQLVASLGGTIMAQNIEDHGARFVLQFPTHQTKSKTDNSAL